MIRSLCLGLALLLSAQAAVARDVTGAVAYRERIALPDDAELKVELRNVEGIVAEVTIATEGRQVPLPFLIVAPDAGAFTLQGAIFVAGQPRWVSAPVAIPPGEGSVDLGTIALTAHVAMGPLIRMRCGGTAIEVGYSDDSVRLLVGERELLLPQTVSGSGARYSDGSSPETVFWNKGANATLTLAGRTLPECVPMIDPPLLPVTARGNEPFWSLQLSETGYVFRPNLDAAEQTGPMVAPVTVEEGVRFELSPTLGAVVARRICRDSMSGMPHPLTVTVTSGEQVLSGCGGAPGDLLAGRWTADLVEGAVLPEGAEVSLVFDMAEGRVFGKSACNRYNGGFTLSGEGLSFGPAAGTMMACPQDLMAVEQVFLKQLESVSRFDLAEDGALELFAGDTVVIRARR